MQLSFMSFGVLFFFCISVTSWFASQKCVNKPTYSKHLGLLQAFEESADCFVLFE